MDDDDAGSWPREWAKGVTAVVAAQVTRYRARRGLSVTRLAAAARMPRPVLSNLLNGQRESVTVAEVYALAAALRVPPAALLVPAGLQPDMEALPGERVSTSAALRWVTGVTPTPGAPAAGDPTVDMLTATVRHDALVKDLRDRMRLVDQGPDDARLRQAAWRSWAALRTCRDLLLAWGAPPALPGDVAWADSYRPDPAEERQPGPPWGFRPGEPSPWAQVP